MAHPYKNQAQSSHKTKTGNMGKVNNLDIPIMRAVGENKAGGIHVSSASMQHKNQSADDGMKRGGHVGKPKHSKPKTKIVMVAPEATANPPSPDPSMAAAGAGSSPAPAPLPPMKRGGKFADGGSVKPLPIKPGPSVPKVDAPSFQKTSLDKFKEQQRVVRDGYKRGGKVTAGAESGVGRLQISKKVGMKPIKG